MFLIFFKKISFQTTVRGHCPSGVTVTDRPSELIYMIRVVTKSFRQNKEINRTTW